jgi:lysophospholipase L1-like esterase
MYGPTDPGRFRIAVIGDSYTFGQGLEPAERFTGVLESLLGPRYEVLNLGVPGHRTGDALGELDQVLTFQPDFVLLQLYINDFERPEMKRPSPSPLLPAEWRGSIEQTSLVYRMLDDRWAHLQSTLGMVDSYSGYLERHLGDPASPDARASFGDLREFFARARAHHVRAGAVLFPASDAMGPFGANYPYGFIHEQMRKVCVESNATCLDLFDLFAKLPNPETSWVTPFDAHPNAATNRQAALLMLTTFQGEWR